MCPAMRSVRNNPHRSCAAFVLGATLALGFSFTMSTSADDVAQWLRRQGLNRLLAVHLENEMASAEGETRDRLAAELAQLYATLLESATDPAQRVELEVRARQLLEAMPDGAADELQLSLQRGLYRAAERIAEDYRLRLVDEEEAARALRIFEESATKLSDLRARLLRVQQALERRVERSGAGDAVIYGNELRNVERSLQSATFLLAWSHYYRAWLSGVATPAGEAEQLFAWLLDPREPVFDADRVPKDLLETDAFARTVLGMALTKSILFPLSVGNRWLQVLEAPGVVPSVRDQLPAWRMVIALDKNDFRMARDVLSEVIAARPNDAPLAWIRLAAVHGLEESTRSIEAQQTATFALAQLAARAELAQVLDLAQRFGAEAIGQEGFAANYVRGVIAYQQAREAHGESEEPAADDATRRFYAEAAEAFRDALVAPDTSRYDTAAAGCRRLIGFCFFFRGEYIEAKDAFLSAIGSLPAGEAPEALWMAIVSLDKLVRAGSSAAEAELEVLLDRFLETYPSSDYASRLILRRAEGLRAASREQVDELLAIPDNSEVYSAAQARAAQMLYELFRQDTENRLDHGRRYVDVAVRLLLTDEADNMFSAPVQRQTKMIRARRVLEVALYEGVDRFEAAAQAFVVLDEIRRSGSIDFSEFADEIDYRRAIYALRTQQPQDAVRIADALWERNTESTWSRAAVRAVFRDAYDRYTESRSTNAPFDDRPAIARLVSFGQRALSEFERSEAALDDARTFSYFAAVADASFQLWQTGRSREVALDALDLYELLLKVRPSSAEFLRRFALLAVVDGRTEDALASWRRLVNGLEIGTDGWYEAKFHQIALLKDMDPARARAVMDQHKSLRPEYGPEPWRTRLRELDQTIVSTGDGGTES